jgi:hypothetical protein
MKKLVYAIPLVLALVGGMQLAHATTPYQTGYLGGISDGKASARDWGDACGNYAWMSADLNACLAGYNVGFKKGCIGMMWYRDPRPEYPTCADYFNVTQK